jgi:hypothetical protein
MHACMQACYQEFGNTWFRGVSFLIFVANERTRNDDDRGADRKRRRRANDDIDDIDDIDDVVEETAD